MSGRARSGGGDVGRFRGVLEHVRNPELTAPAAAQGVVARKPVVVVAVGSAGDPRAAGGGRASESGNLVANAHCDGWLTRAAVTSARGFFWWEAFLGRRRDTKEGTK